MSVCVPVHSNVAPAGKLVNIIFVVSPEQIVAGVGVAIATGAGLTVIDMSFESPRHPSAVGVIVYVAEPIFEVELVSV